MSAVDEYRMQRDHMRSVNTDPRHVTRLADAAIAELDAELRTAYENADFDEPLTFEEYRADLQEQAAARAKYEAERSTP